MFWDRLICKNIDWDLQKENVAKKFIGNGDQRSSTGRGKKGQSQPAAYKPFGTQRKEKKESVVNQKEQQVWLFLCWIPFQDSVFVVDYCMPLTGQV